MMIFIDRLELAKLKIELKGEVEKEVRNLCVTSSTIELTNATKSQLEQYVKSIVAAAWLDYLPELDDIDFKRDEKKAELVDRATADFAKLIRIKAINQIK
ncbi:hypothetical protein [Vibrio sp. 10N.222.54.A3]|uniref:hypothetical protein n=1 Tax=Vibrio sp. 10N.222.54.A3 TaxID=3229633 RepID=UPI00354D7F70